MQIYADFWTPSAKWLVSAVAGLVASIPMAVVCLTVLMTFDWLTGLGGAIKKGKFDQTVAKNGLITKGQIMLLVLALDILVYILQRETGGKIGVIEYAGSTVTLWFCVHETLSIAQNVGVGPKFLFTGLEKIQGVIEAAGESEVSKKMAPREGASGFPAEAPPKG